jgi:signal transduction histidine kinase
MSSDDIDGDRASTLTSKLGSATLHRLDPVRFERILSNLFENAARYAGGVTRVTLDRDAGALVVTVDDAGPGVVENERVAIFGRFHRGETTSRPDQPKGTGSASRSSTSTCECTAARCS